MEGRRVLLRRLHQSGAGRAWQEVSPRPRYQDRRDRLGASADRPGEYLGWRALDRGRRGLLRRRRRRVQRGRCEDGQAAVDLPRESTMEGVTDDVPRGWKAV